MHCICDALKNQCWTIKSKSIIFKYLGFDNSKNEILVIHACVCARECCKVHVWKMKVASKE